MTTGVGEIMGEEASVIAVRFYAGHQTSPPHTWQNDLVRTLLNIIWLIFAGFWLFVGYIAVGVVLCVLILTIPWGIASFRIGFYSLWPFGREVISKPTAGVGSLLGNIVWVIIAGWWLALAHIVSGIALCVTIIGIPLGIADFKLVPVSLMPLGKEIVSTRRGAFDTVR